MQKNHDAPPPPSTGSDADPGAAPQLPALLAFDPVPVRTRHDGLTPERQRAFIEHLADGLSVARAAHAAGVSEQSVYRLRRRADAGGFAAAWDAVNADRLKRIFALAFDTVLTGTVKRIFYHGELIDERVVHSERLLLWMLEKGHSLLGPDKPRQQVAEDWEAAMERLGEGDADGTGAGAGSTRVWQDDDGIWVTNFPPPHGYDGFEDGAVGSPDYARTLTDEEEAANRGVQARRHARAADARDAFFGLGPPASSPRPRAPGKRRRSAKRAK